MSELSTIGRVVKISEPVVNEEYESRTVELVIEIPNGEYKPKYAIFELYAKIGAEHDNVENLIKFNKVGDMVTVDFNLGGFTWQAKKDTKWNKVGDDCYMNKLSAWRVRKAEEQEVVIEDADVPAFATEEEDW